MKNKLDKNYKYYLFTKAVIYGVLISFVMFFPLIAIASVNVILFIISVFILPILYWVICYLAITVWYNNYTYSIDEKVFVKQYGVLTIRSTNIPYERIQNVDILRPFFMRVFGLSKLYIQTAGGVSYGVGTAEGSLPGLSEQTAIHLQKEIINRSQINSSNNIKTSGV